MSHRSKRELGRLLVVTLFILLASALAACDAVSGLLPGGGGGAPAEGAPQEAAEAEQPATEATVEPSPMPSPTPFPTAEATTAAVEETPTEEGTPGEPTPTRSAPLLGTPEGEGTPGAESTAEATPLGGEAATTPEATLTDGQGGGASGGGAPLGGTAEADTAPEATTTPEPTVTATVTATEVTPAPTTAAGDETITYTVLAGDTLSEIAHTFDSTTDELVSLNQDTYPSLTSNPNAIEVGWGLIVPNKFGGTLYTVKQSDVLYEIARVNNTTIEAIISLNEDTYPSLRTDPGSIEIGWVLKIP